MKQGLKGNQLPESEGDYMRLVEYGGLKFGQCICCKQSFTNANVFTSDGWKETQISGFCEACFDDIAEEDE